VRSPLKKLSCVPGFEPDRSQRGERRLRQNQDPVKITRAKPPSPAGTDPPTLRTSSAISMVDRIEIMQSSRPCSQGGMLLGTLLRNTRKQCTDLGLPVTSVPPERAD
jgi:hypothetical protein